MTGRFWILALVALVFYAVGAQYPGVYKQAVAAIPKG